MGNIIQFINKINTEEHVHEKLTKFSLSLRLLKNATQKYYKITLELKILLVEPENYIPYKIFPILEPDIRTGLHYLTFVNNNFIARDDSSLL